MPTMWQRDLETDRANLTAWLRRRLPDAGDLRVSDLVAPQSSGFSNDTLLFDLEYTSDGRARREPLVVRIEPTGFQVFPEYDLGLQFRTMQRLRATAIPVPPTRWIETEDRRVLGGAFYVMDQVSGRVPPDNPPYHAAGWLTDATPEERAAVWWSGIETLAAIHRLDWRALGFADLARPRLGATPLDWQLAYYERYEAWASRGLPQPTIEAARAWLRAHQPSDEPTVLCWGDARIGNIIFAGTRPAAVLDWEMVALGSPEMDLAWSIFLDRHHSEGIGVARLDGFPSHEESVARYEQLTGHRVRHLRYYQVLAGYRFAVIMCRIAQQMVTYGAMDEAGGRAFELDNTVTRLLARILDLPEPSAA
ncbi:phosphotransferase family protein [bacterium]|nr:phosphotransferase family protein [bacterium]